MFALHMHNAYWKQPIKGRKNKENWEIKSCFLMMIAMMTMEMIIMMLIDDDVDGNYHADDDDVDGNDGNDDVDGNGGNDDDDDVDDGNWQGDN